MDELINTKRCSKCGVEKEATTEYFVRDSRHTEKLRSQCKQCDQRYRASRDPSKARENNARYYATNRDKILERQRRFRQEHPEKIREYNQRYAVNNPHKLAEKQRQYRRAKPEIARAQSKRYANKHPDRVKARAARWQAANADRVAEYRRRYQSENGARIAASPVFKAAQQRARARKRNASGTHTAADIKLIYASQGGKCWYCLEPVGDKYHIDHRVPLSRGGSNDARNLVISCATCNLSKGAKLPQEWNGRLF